MADPAVNKNAPIFVPVARPYLPPMATKNAMLDCVDAGWISGGPMVEQFERGIAEAHFTDAGAFGVACNSGTTALHLAVVAAGVNPGDRVLMPTLTMVAVANAVLYAGGVPVFADSRASDGNPNVGEFTKRFGYHGCRTAIVAHLYGVPSEANDAIRSSLGFDGPLIQDCCESHYATRNGKLGGANDLLTFSFYANKIVACGEGGMVATLRADWADRMRRLRAHAFTPGDHFHHSELAFGYRMTDLQAAVGFQQHEMAKTILSLREQVAADYRRELANIDWIEFPSRPAGSVWWVFPILVRRESGVTVEAAREKLAQAGIETRRYFKPLHTQPHLTRFVNRRDAFPVADDLYARGFYLPLYPQLTRQHVEYIAKALRQL